MKGKQIIKREHGLVSIKRNQNWGITYEINEENKVENLN